MEPVSIIIADSLTNDFMSPKERFLGQKVNIGSREIHRLLGPAEAFGTGPLPVFLNDAMTAKKEGRPVFTLFLRDVHDPDDPMQQHELLQYGRHNIKGSDGVDFISPISEIVSSAYVIDTPTLSMPVSAFHAVMRTIIGKDILDLTHEERSRIRFFLSGVYTHVRVLSTASKLRNDYQFPNVYVCPHLVGSENFEVHLATLQIDFPNNLVKVVQSLSRFYELAGIDPKDKVIDSFESCNIGPEAFTSRLETDQKAIIETLYIGYSHIQLRPLSGGYSGSLLCLTEGMKQDAKTASEILKIDACMKMQGELQGYSQVKDLLGKHVPAFSLPVSNAHLTGIKMELASMHGVPRTLQSMFVNWEVSGTQFLIVFKSALDILLSKLYCNTKRIKKIYYYRTTGLHTRQQKIWLKENLGHILPGQDLRSENLDLGHGVSISNPIQIFEMITKHMDRVAGEVCICHGDLNFANLLCDERENIWVIDWAYTKENPIEFDFAKMENDLKFVMSKHFLEEDREQLLKFETFLIHSFVLPEIEHLPEALSFVKHDERYCKIYMTLYLIRKKYQEVCSHGFHVLYKIALLKFAVHTLSFDERRGRGECKPVQLVYALMSVSLLVDHISQDDFHKKIGPDKPFEYPNRFPVVMDHLTWNCVYPGYFPEYYVHPDVLKFDQSIDPNGWADPEDINQVTDLKARRSFTGDLLYDPEGRPLNPKGRTGIIGRGLLGKWGPNFAADPVVTRLNPITSDLEVLLIKREGTHQWGLPGAIILDMETPWQAAGRSLKQKTNLELDFHDAKILCQMAISDFRNTDHAWMESTALFLHLEEAAVRNTRLREGNQVEDVAWVQIVPEVLNHLYANHSEIIIKALELLLDGNTPHLDRPGIKKILLEA